MSLEQLRIKLVEGKDQQIEAEEDNGSRSRASKSTIPMTISAIQKRKDPKPSQNQDRLSRREF
jgi:hypothetical protein